MSRVVRHVLSAACVLFVVAWPPAVAQIPSLKQALSPEKSTASQPANETPEAKLARLKDWQQQARDSLAELDSPGASAAVPNGITADEQETHRRNLELMVLTLTQAIETVNKALTGSGPAGKKGSTAAPWTGFDEKPPYSILLEDELLNERDAVSNKIDSYKNSLSHYEHLLESVMQDAKIAEDNLGTCTANVQHADAANADAAKWRLTAARTKSRLITIRANLLDQGSANFRANIASATSDLAELEKKIKIAHSNIRFDEEDIAKIDKITSQRKDSLRKEVEALAKRIKTARQTRAQAQSALDELNAKATPGNEPDGLALAKLRLEVADSRLDTLQYLTERLEDLIHIQSVTLQAYKDRLTAYHARNQVERNKPLASLRDLHERLQVARTVYNNELSISGADLTKLESRATNILSDDPRYPLINDQRVLKGEKIATLQRMGQNIDSLHNLLGRWIGDFTPKDGGSWTSRLGNLAGRAKETAIKIWNFKVMSFDDTYEAEDGQTLSIKVPVTAGMLLRAILFFVIGYWIASRFTTRLQNTVVSRGHIAEAQAKTLRNWTMIAIGVFLVLGTLAFLKIPLTVFAFFGGALAIGLGFGTQTLIKNFISGIIVLAERKVRVGDMLDVDGIVGTVTEVNTRSSVIRGADDVETLIPNSVFLENRVTNWTLNSRKVRRNLRVGVAYGTDTKTVMQVLTECAGRHGLVCKDPPPFAIFEDFGDSALVFTLYFWVEIAANVSALVVTSDLRLMIEKRFSEAGVIVPFPQRDVNLTSIQPIAVRLASPEEQGPS